MYISNRLETIASLINKGAKVADVGCDHAILAIYLVKNDIAQQVIATDVNKGPLDQAKRNIENFNCDAQIKTRLGSGLTKVNSDEIDTVVIAGMGGSLMVDILNEGIDKLENVKQIILQPNVAERNCREWFQNNNFMITNEVLIKENDIIYEIIVAEKGNVKYSEDEIEFGPILLKEKSPLFIEKYTLLHDKLSNISTNIPPGPHKVEFLAKISNISKILNS